MSTDDPKSGHRATIAKTQWGGFHIRGTDLYVWHDDEADLVRVERHVRGKADSEEVGHAKLRAGGTFERAGSLSDAEWARVETEIAQLERDDAGARPPIARPPKATN